MENQSDDLKWEETDEGVFLRKVKYETVELELEEEDYVKYLKYAHENNMSFNELAEKAVKEAMENEMKQFESDMSDTYNIFNELETILYKIGDAPTEPTEDQLMNMLHAVIDTHKTSL